MSLTIIKAPSTVLTSTFESKFSFVGNPIYYDIQRKDAAITGVGSSSGNVAFNMGTGTSIYSVNDTVYVYATNGSTVLIDGEYTVLSQAVISGFNWISISLPVFSGYIGINGGFINNMERYNHRIISNLIINGVATSERSFSTDAKGLGRVYINSIVQDYLSNVINFDYTAINELLTDFAVPFKIAFKEGWLGYTDPAPKSDAILYYAVKSVQQLKNDNRMVQFEVFYIDASIYSTAKFSTGFAKPKMWTGYPFSIGALLTDLNATVTKEIKSYPANSTASQTLTINDKGVYSLLCNPATGSQRFDIWLQTDGVIDDGVNDYVENYVDSYIVNTQ